MLIAGKTITHILAACMSFVDKELQVKSVSLGVANFLMICMSILNVTLVMMCGNSVTTESSKTPFLCYKLQEHFPADSNERIEILILAKQVRTNVVKITAADFFEINRSTLFGLLATCTTYVIVVLQFSGTF